MFMEAYALYTLKQNAWWFFS